MLIANVKKSLSRNIIIGTKQVLMNKLNKELGQTENNKPLRYFQS
jgi:hypothetical protein